MALVLTELQARVAEVEAAVARLREALDLNGLAAQVASAEHLDPAPAPAVHVDIARRLLVAGGQTVRLSLTEARIAAALLRAEGEEVDLLSLDAAARPPDAPACSPAAIQKHVHRIRRKLRDAGLADLAETLRAGWYRSYAWHVPEQMSIVGSKCPRHCLHHAAIVS